MDFPFAHDHRLRPQWHDAKRHAIELFIDVDAFIQQVPQRRKVTHLNRNMPGCQVFYYSLSTTRNIYPNPWELFVELLNNHLV